MICKYIYVSRSERNLPNYHINLEMAIFSLFVSAIEQKIIDTGANAILAIMNSDANQSIAFIQSTKVHIGSTRRATGSEKIFSR